VLIIHFSVFNGYIFLLETAILKVTIVYSLKGQDTVWLKMLKTCLRHMKA
jgi:hypothetical protein